MWVYSSVHPHIWWSVVARQYLATLYKSTWLELVRSYKLLKQQREIQIYKTALVTMAFCRLHLSFLQNGVYSDYKGSDQPVLGNTENHHFSGNLSVSSDFSCKKTFSKETWPVSKLCLSLAAACCDNIRQGNIKLRTICWTFGNTL